MVPEAALVTRTCNEFERIFITAGLCLLSALAGCGGAAVQTPGSDRAASDLDKLRTATRAFRDLDAAVAAGYPRDVPDCLVHESHGAMGFHHVNRAFLDGTVDIEHPEILLYERLPDGEYKLNGVEFIVPYRAWSRDSLPPTVMAQPMKHEDRLKFWYRHVWAWSDNADGMFADFNPSVRCSEDTRKVYAPVVEP